MGVVVLVKQEVGSMSWGQELKYRWMDPEKGTSFHF